MVFPYWRKNRNIKIVDRVNVACESNYATGTFGRGCGVLRSRLEQAGAGRSGWVLISELWARVRGPAGAGGRGGARSRAISVRVRRRMPTTSKNIRRASAFHTPSAADRVLRLRPRRGLRYVSAGCVLRMWCALLSWGSTGPGREP
jgi:hypothetical protein